MENKDISEFSLKQIYIWNSFYQSRFVSYTQLLYKMTNESVQALYTLYTWQLILSYFFPHF